MEKNKILNIGFITNEGFPSGMAMTNRIVSLATGLTELEQRVTIFCIRPTEKKQNQINKEINGVFKNINYVYTPDTVIWPDNKLFKLIVTIKGIIGFYFHFNKINRISKFDVMICTTADFFSNYFFVKLLSKNGVKVLTTGDEYPHVYRNSSSYPKWFAKYYLKTHYKMFGGMITTTNHLLIYYKKLVSKGAKLIHIPITVEPERFQTNVEESPIKEDYIAYCGNIGQNEKDGVPILIEAFGLIKPEFKHLKLVIIGGTNPSIQEAKFKELKLLTIKHNVENYVIFTGKIHRDEMPKYLSHAKILALARPDNIQGQGGFPTKLGEYLATGRPVVITTVGELKEYLTDGYNAYLAEPGSAISFAQKMKIALNNLEIADQVGKKGQELANTVFNYKIQSKNLKLFLEKIL